MVRLLIGLVIGVAAVVFAVQNPEQVSYHFLAWDFQMSRAFVVLGALVIGVVIGWALTGLRRIGQRRR